jgi:zinc D-Ala-D-Ala carboxypeptidase
MSLRLRLLCGLAMLASLTTCQHPAAQGPRADGPGLINPLPVPDPHVRWPRGEPDEIQLLADDAALAGAICRDGTGLLPASGTLFGHFRFDEPGEAALVNAPAELSGGSCQQVHANMAGPLSAMVAAATVENAAVGRSIMAISCYRSVERQADLFCDRPRVAQRGYGGQARWIAPPGYSEHATGLSIDFGSRGENQCNLRSCFAGTQVGRWLADNAGRFGFELSFPQGNEQGVAYEPWHYRFVGSVGARAMFDRAAAPVSAEQTTTAR